MGATASLSTYAFGTSVDFEAKSFERSSTHGVTTFSGISPFHVPKAIEVQLVSPSEAILSFAYENEEPGEEAPRHIANNVDVRLGEKSKKVLKVFLHGDVRERLLSRDFFSTSYTESLVDSVPSSAAFSLRKNAELVAMLLRNLPDEFVKQVLAQKDH
jgi:hypothetical protein